MDSPKTSMKVFRGWIRRSVDGVLLEENILSKGCYLDWLETRKHVIKHPKASFRRTLLAHVRGADGRAPFDEDVEKSLLRKLRKKTKRVDAFDMVFGVEELTPRKHSHWRKKMCAAYGFHERQGLSGQIVASSEPTHPTTVVWKSPQVVSAFDFYKLQMGQILHLPPDDLIKRLEVAKGLNIKLFSPALPYFMTQGETISPRLTREFTVPSESERFFDQDRPVAEYIVNRHTWEMKWIDAPAEDLMLGSVEHARSLFSSVIEFFHTTRYIIPAIEHDGEFWFRFAGTCGGKLVAVLVHARTVCSEYNRAFLQVDWNYFEQHEKFPPLLL